MDDPRDDRREMSDKVGQLESELELRDGEIARLTKLYAATEDALGVAVHQVQIAECALAEAQKRIKSWNAKG